MSDGKELLKAADDGDLPKVKSLVESNIIDIEYKDTNGRNALYWASRNGHLNLVKYLLDKGLKTNEADKGGRSPLWIAACNGHVGVIKALIERKADIEHVGYNSQRPLHIAANKGKLDVVKLLLLNGANMEATTTG